MRWAKLFALPLGLLALAGLTAGEDPKDKPAPRATALFDVAGFLKEHDADGDGALSLQEMPGRFRHAFARLDANGDGKVPLEELTKGLAHLHARRRTADFVMTLVEMSDCDECCAEELATVYTFLRKLDRDGDGKISAEELKAGREALTQQRADNILAELDADKDGKISLKEARGSVRQHFKELDSDGDGFISRDELIKGATASDGSSKAPKVKDGKARD